MKVLYYCQTSKYPSLLAGALHLNKFKRELTYRDFLTYADSINPRSYVPYYLGRDDLGTEVYMISTDNNKTLPLRIIKSFLKHFINDSNKTIVVDSLPRPGLFLICLLKLSTIDCLGFFLQKFMVLATWANRRRIRLA